MLLSLIVTSVLLVGAADIPAAAARTTAVTRENKSADLEEEEEGMIGLLMKSYDLKCCIMPQIPQASRILADIVRFTNLLTYLLKSSGGCCSNLYC